MARRPLAQEEQGQMMVLAAVLLVIGLIALAGMVARVNQLGSQTSVEADKAILGEAAPLAEAVETGLTTLSDRSVATVGRTILSASITSSGAFLPSDVGKRITGAGIPVGTTITVVSSTSNAQMSAASTLTVSGQASIGDFALSTSSTPTLEMGVISLLEQLQRIEASHGLFMDYELTCTGVTNKADGTGGNPAQGVVIVHLSDGDVWVELRSSVTYARGTASSACVSVYG